MIVCAYARMHAHIARTHALLHALMRVVLINHTSIIKSIPDLHIFKALVAYAMSS